MIKSITTKITINRYLIVAYLLLSFLFFTLMSHYTKTILEKIEYSADNGYIKYDLVYSIDTEFVFRFQDDKEMVEYLKNEYESFTLIKREGILYGVYIFNDIWQIPDVTRVVYPPCPTLVNYHVQDSTIVKEEALL